MKTWKCHHCKREVIKEENIVCSQCVCGGYFEKVEVEE